MNNNYDRDESPRTYDEMVAAGYQMTAEGVWIPQDEMESMEVTITEEDLIDERKVQLFLLKSGETIISEYTQSLSGQTYFFDDPRIVMIQASSGDGETTQTTIAYSDWMPLSKERSFTVSSEWVVCRTEPLDSLVQSYLSNKNG